MATYGEDVKILTSKALYTETIKSKTGTTGIAIADAGAVTIGIAGGGEIHLVHGGMGGLRAIGQDTGLQIAYGRTNTSVGWGYLGADATNALQVWSGGTGGSPSAGSSQLLAVSHAGVVTLGASTGGANHIAYGDSFKIKKTLSTVNNETAFNMSVTPTEVYLDVYGDDASTNGTLIMRTLRSDGTNPLTILSVSGAANLVLGYGSGNVHTIRGSYIYMQDITTSSSTTYATFNGNDFYKYSSSSIRYKNNIKNITDNCLDKVLQLRPVTFFYNNDHCKDNWEQIGFIAEEVEKIEPTLIDYDRSKKKPVVENVKYAQMTVLLTKAIQELAAKVAALEAK